MPAGRNSISRTASKALSVTCNAIETSRFSTDTIKFQPLIQNLTEAYISLEAKAADQKYSHSLSDIFKEVRDKYLKENDEPEAEKAQYEIDLLNFNVHDNKLTFLYSSTNEKGELFEYPSLKHFTEEAYLYLLKRQSDVKEPMLKAKYSHILWLSPKRRVEFAQTAIKEYLKLIPIRERQDMENLNEHYGSTILELVNNAFLLSLSIKYQTDKIVKTILRLVKKYPIESSSASVIRFRLIELMFSYKSIFEISNFKGLTSVCEKLYKKIYAENNKHLAIDMLSLICKIEKKLGNQTEPWERRIAELWEELSIEREDDTNLVTTEFCKNAINQYKKIKDTQKVKELEKKFDELRKRIKLGEFGQDFDLSEMMKDFRKYADKLSNNTPEVIIRSLMTDKGLLPTYEEMEKQASENKKHSFLSHLGNTSIIDRNGNNAQYFSGEEEYAYYEILQSYHFSLQLTKNHLLREIFISCIKKRKLTSDTILSYLNRYSWFGKELKMQENGERTHTYCWLALIAPALNEFFINLEFYLRNPINYPNFVLCIDSLTLKIEGMLRDICEFKGVTTYEFKKDKKGRTISQEKDIHKLLYEEEVTNLIDKDDLLFFKFLLVEKAGYSLRHKVAHSLMTFREYHLNYMILLIMAILKFGKYDFVPKATRETP